MEGEPPIARRKRWPQPGDRLVHSFRKQEGQIVAEVISLDRKTGRVAVGVSDITYPSLSAAAAAIARTRDKRLGVLGPQEAGGAGAEQSEGGVETLHVSSLFSARARRQSPAVVGLGALSRPLQLSTTSSRNSNSLTASAGVTYATPEFSWASSEPGMSPKPST